MEKRFFVREGTLLPGLRFQPTDEELVYEYLRCKVYSLPLPASVIPVVQFFKLDPWDLPGDPEEERYFFSKKERNPRNRTQSKRATSSGYWKATGSGKQISPPMQNLGMVGYKRTFVFHKGKAPNGCRTKWFMHEYSLTSHAMSSDNQNSGITSNLEDWVICHIRLRQRVDEDCDANMLDQCSDNFSLTSTSMNISDGGYRNSLYTYSSPMASSSSSSYTLSSHESQYDEEYSYLP